MIELPSELEQSFSVAMGELGFCSTSWLYVREVASVGGDHLVRTLRDQLGRSYPVLDAVAADWLSGHRAPNTDPAAVHAACQGIQRLLLVGLEADFLDALLPQLKQVEVGLLRYSTVEADWERVSANYADQVKLIDLAAAQQWAGSRSGLLTFVYGHTHHVAHVRPSWLRFIGDDIRTQFRSILAWNVLRAPLYVYPRWLVQTPLSDFSEVL
jgi:hypothetical protein